MSKNVSATILIAYHGDNCKPIISKTKKILKESSVSSTSSISETREKKQDNIGIVIDVSASKEKIKLISKDILKIPDVESVEYSIY